MEEPIQQKFYLFGTNIVESMPYFLYEVSIYLITKNMASLLDHQFYKSNKLLTVKEDVTVKKYKSYSFVRYVDLLGVTETFIKENNLLKYENERTR